MLWILVLVVALLPACSDQTPNPEPEPEPVRVPVPAPQPQTTDTASQTSKEITIERVTAANPVVIEGRARTFENNVIVRVRDARGNLIAEDFTTSNGEMGQHNPFRAELFMTRDPGGKVTAEALEYSAKDGSERSLTSSTIDYPVELVNVQLFFPEKNPGDCTVVKAVTRRVPKTVSLARLLAEALLRGPLPSEGALSNPFPERSDVQSVILREGTLTVDLNDRLRNVGGSCRAQAIRATIERTMQQLPAVKEVVITAGGSRDLALQP